MFYIHGGSFLVGDASEPRHDGATLAARGIIVATVNFRLGLFGFFSHPELRGANAGLLDLAAALDWVRENALAFGGDPFQNHRCRIQFRWFCSLCTCMFAAHKRQGRGSHCPIRLTPRHQVGGSLS